MKHILTTPFLLLLLCNVTLAQQTDEKWYWAVQEDTGKIIAYTAHGTTNELMDLTLPEYKEGWRLDDQTILIEQLASYPELWLSLYILTPNEIHPITLNGDTKVYEFANRDNHLRWFSPRANRISSLHLVYTFNDENYDSIHFLINLEKYTIEPLFSPDIEVWQFSFSQDGQQMYYVVGNMTSNTMQLRQRSLLSGEDRLIYTTDSVDYFVIDDADNNRWLVSNLDWSSAFFVFDDGTTEPTPIYAEQTLNLCPSIRSGEYTEPLWYPDCYSVYPSVDGITAHIESCEQNCVGKLFLNAEYVDFLTSPTNEFAAVEFKLRPSRGYQGMGTRVDDNRRVVVISTDYWLIRASGQPTLLGSHLSRPTHTGETNQLSRNRHWLIVEAGADTTNRRLHIWNLLDERIAFEEKMQGDWVDTDQFDEGLVFTVHRGLTPTSERLFRFEDEAIIEIPIGLYFDILPDGSLLSEIDDNWAGHSRDEDAIFRYDPDTNTKTVLLENVNNIRLEDRPPR